MKITKDNVVKYLYQSPRTAYAAARQKKAIGLTGPGQTCGIIAIITNQKEYYAYKKWNNMVLIKNGELPLTWFIENGFGLAGQCLKGLTTYGRLF